MIGPTGAVRVMVATKPVDFRKGAEGLAALVRDAMMADPFSGARPIAHLEGFKGILQVRPADRGHRRPGATCLFPLLNSKTKGPVIYPALCTLHFLRFHHSHLHGLVHVILTSGHVFLRH